MSAAAESSGSARDGVVRLAVQIDSFLNSIEETGDLSQLLQSVGGPEKLDHRLHQQIDELAQLAAATGDGRSELEAFRKDAEFQIVGVQENMILELSAHPAVAGGKDLAVEQVVAWLKEHGVRLGVDLTAIRQAIEAVMRGAEITGVIIARGQPPTDSIPARIEYYGRPGPGQPLALLGKSQVANPRFSWLCQAGDCIARCVPPVPGKCGYNAWNKPLEPKPAGVAVLHARKNVRQVDEAFYAGLDGMVALREGQLEVRQVLAFDSEVTRQTGPIDFPGEIHVRAAVRSGAVIRAGGDIVVDGAVEDVSIESTGGNICLRHGVAGRHRGLIRAKGNVETAFAENANIQAGGDIVVKVGALKSNLSAGRAIILNHSRGQLIGGVAVAGSYIEAKRIGTGGGTLTELIVGLGFETMLKLAEIDTEISRLLSCRDAASDLANRIKRSVGDPMKLPASELERYKELRRVELAVELKVQLMGKTRRELLSASAKTQGGEVRILVAALPNVVINIGDVSVHLKDPLDACVLIYDKKRAKIQAKTRDLQSAGVCI